MLHNTGGSIASDVSVRIIYPARPDYEEVTYTDFTIDAPIDHGQARAVSHRKRHPEEAQTTSHQARSTRNSNTPRSVK